jgi:tetratricopeptide (TPR) repeat protein
LAANPRIDELRKKLQAEPGSRLFAQLAEELRKSGDLAGAIAVARDGLEKNPGFWSARMTLGRALFDTGDLEGAKSEFEAVVRAAPDNIHAGRYLAECLEGAGDLGGALERLEQTTTLSPSDPLLRERIDELRARMAARDREAARGAGTGGDDLAPIPVSEYDGPFEIEGPVGLGFGTQQVEAPPAGQPEFEMEGVQDLGTWTTSVGEPAELASPGPESLVVEEFEVLETEPGEELGTIPFTEAPALSAAAPAPLVALEPPGAAGEPGVRRDTGLDTPTLAELYVSQGLTEKARAVYRRIVAADPRHAQARARLAELDAEAAPAAATLAVAGGVAAGAGEGRAATIRAAIGRLERFREAVRRG